MARDVCCAPVSGPLLLLDVVDYCISSDRERERRVSSWSCRLILTSSGGTLRFAL